MRRFYTYHVHCLAKNSISKRRILLRLYYDVEINFGRLVPLYISIIAE